MPLSILLIFGTFALSTSIVLAVRSLSDRRRKRIIERVVRADTFTPDEAALAIIKDDLLRAAMPWAEYRALRGHLYKTWKPRKVA